MGALWLSAAWRFCLILVVRHPAHISPHFAVRKRIICVLITACPANELLECFCGAEMFIIVVPNTYLHPAIHCKSRGNSSAHIPQTVGPGYRCVWLHWDFSFGLQPINSFPFKCQLLLLLPAQPTADHIPPRRPVLYQLPHQHHHAVETQCRGRACL